MHVSMSFHKYEYDITVLLFIYYTVFCTKVNMNSTKIQTKQEIHKNHAIKRHDTKRKRRRTFSAVLSSWFLKTNFWDYLILCIGFLFLVSGSLYFRFFFVSFIFQRNTNGCKWHQNQHEFDMVIILNTGLYRLVQCVRECGCDRRCGN